MDALDYRDEPASAADQTVRAVTQRSETPVQRSTGLNHTKPSGLKPQASSLSAQASSLSWWSGPGGLREMLLLSLPLIISTVSWTVMHFTNRVFLLWYSADAVAAALPAGNLSFAVICFPL